MSRESMELIFAAEKIRKHCEKCEDCNECPFGTCEEGCRITSHIPANWDVGGAED